MRRRAVITSCGVVAPQALGVEAFWSLVRKGKSAMAAFTRFDPTITGCLFGGEVPEFSFDFIPKDMKPKRMARHTVLGLKAAQELGLPQNSEFGIRLGLATSDSVMIANSGIQRVTRGLAYIGATSAVQSPPNAAVGAIVSIYQPKGEVHTVTTACAAGLDAIGLAARDVIDGRAQCVLAGGTDSPLGITPLAEFVKSGLASTRNNAPERASRPFDVFADSGVLSEAAGLVVIEEWNQARKRNTPILAEIIGYGNRSDLSPTQPGSGFLECMARAVDSAQLDLNDIDYVSAWGPGHPALDLAELEAIANLFASSADHLPISSIKGVTGNPLAAAGPLQVIAAIQGMMEGIIVPTANLEIPIGDFPMRFVRGQPLIHQHKHILINAHGLGGANSSLILGPAPTPFHLN